jgi:hypothetical protein
MEKARPSGARDLQPSTNTLGEVSLARVRMYSTSIKLEDVHEI